MAWEYRICKEHKPEVYDGYYEYGVIEVYYPPDDAAIEAKNGYGWGDSRKNVLIWDNLKDLHSTAKLIMSAFTKPVLEIKGERLIETDEML